jgi:D-aminoacyl-tRNA deacylase
LGGEPRTLDVAFGSKVKVIAQAMRRLASERGLGWQVAIEADHHGPTIEKPIIFVEIGSTENEWNNEKAGGIAARAIIEAAGSDAAFPCYVGFGGTHYAPKFAPKIFDGGIAVGHIISGYALERDGVDADRVKQAIEKNAEKVDGVLVDWKGIKKEAKDRLADALNSLGVKWEKA